MGTTMSESLEGPVVYFDGVCGLCNHFVNFVLKHDRVGQIRFAPLQGELAAQRLPQSDTENISSVVVEQAGNVFRYSTAVVHVFLAMGGGWRILGRLLWCVPRPLRDIGYRFIGRNRYRMFGRKETCRLPTPSERARFLN
jgi:predicted DCC family thiol-disulfide oxidoreductase YuxK